MKKRILVFETHLSGHHLEYLHHLYLSADRVDATLCFVLPRTFEHCRATKTWPERPNVHLELIDERECGYSEGLRPLHDAWVQSWTLRRYVRRFRADEVLLITMVYPYPLLPLWLPRGVRVSGILYRLWPYEWRQIGWAKRLKDLVQTAVMARAASTRRVFVLNDSSAVAYLNRRFASDRFGLLTDPVCASAILGGPAPGAERSTRIEDVVVYLHAGNIDRRKGSLLILQAIGLLTDEQLRDKVFVFAGQVNDWDRAAFVGLLSGQQQRARIIVHEGFLPDDEMQRLFAAADVVLAPYANIGYSSGIVGHAARMCKPVIGPREGLLGKLIRRHHLGLAVPALTPATLAQAIVRMADADVRRATLGHVCQADGMTAGERYVDTHTIAQFCQTLWHELDII